MNLNLAEKLFPKVRRRKRTFIKCFKIKLKFINYCIMIKYNKLKINQIIVDSVLVCFTAENGESAAF